MDRGIMDESFVGRALEEARYENGRWIANQSCFNGIGELQPSVHAALVTAFSIYTQRYDWDEQCIKDALAAKTKDKARDLIDLYWQKIPKKN